jgi:flagellar hook assembly protein FlgD
VGFVFNHNRGGEPLEASLTVSDALGRTVFRVRETFTENTSTCRRFVWDGKHANGAPAGDGIYFAKIRLTDVDGVSVTAHTRIVKMH